MKVNKAIFLNFNTTSKSTTSINVNFPVKNIHVKSASYSAEVPITSNSQGYITLTSDLTNGEPIAILYNDTAFSANQFCDVSFQPYKPFNVNGTYNFYLQSPSGAEYKADGNDYISLILEFNGVDAPDH
jgi:hypothetical protein